MNAFSVILPLFFIFVLLYATVKKVKVYDSFVLGIKGAIPLLLSIFPYLTAILIMTEVMEKSGLSDALLKVISPVFSFLGIPKEMGKLVMIKPFSGSGATAILNELLVKYGADSYIGRCACVCYGSSETVFYIGAVYFSSVKKKKLIVPILISLLACFLATVFGCFLCRILPFG